MAGDASDDEHVCYVRSFDMESSVASSVDTPRLWYQWPRDSAWVEGGAWSLCGWPQPDLDRRGFDRWGREVWVCGPEFHRVQGRKRRVWSIRTRTAIAARYREGADPRAWDCGWHPCYSRAEALATFRAIVSEPS